MDKAELWYTIEPDGTVSIWYGDGDQCGQLYGNLGLDITAQEVAEALGIKHEKE